MPSEATQFTPETAVEMGIRSGLARRPIDHEADAKKAYKAALSLMDLLTDRIFVANPCKVCKRGGPVDLRTLDSLSKTLLSLIESIQERAWGKPATESRHGRKASIDDFKRARKQVADAKHDPPPPDLPPDPTP